MILDMAFSITGAWSYTSLGYMVRSNIPITERGTITQIRVKNNDNPNTGKIFIVDKNTLQILAVFASAPDADGIHTVQMSFTLDRDIYVGFVADSGRAYVRGSFTAGAVYSSTKVPVVGATWSTTGTWNYLLCHEVTINAAKTLFKFDDGSVWRPVATVPEFYTSKVPVLASNNDQGVIITTNRQLYGAGWKAFDASTTTFWGPGGALPATLEIEFPEPIVLERYAYIIPPSGYANYNYLPRAWYFQGYNTETSSYETLDYVSRTSGMANGYTYYYPFTNTTAYKKYRMYISAAWNASYANFINLALYTRTPEIPEHWEQVGVAPITEEMLDTYGAEGIGSLLTQGLINDLPLAFTLFSKNDLPEALSAKLTASPLPRVILPKGDLDITNVSVVKSMSITSTQTGNGIARLAVSADKGVTWKTISEGSWIDIEVTDLNAMKNAGISPAVFNALTSEQWTELIGTSRYIRFAYYLEIDTTADEANVDMFTITADMLGEWNPAIHRTHYDYAYTNQYTLQITFSANGDYKINF